MGGVGERKWLLRGSQSSIERERGRERENQRANLESELER